MKKRFFLVDYPTFPHRKAIYLDNEGNQGLGDGLSLASAFGGDFSDDIPDDGLSLSRRHPSFSKIFVFCKISIFIFVFTGV